MVWRKKKTNCTQKLCKNGAHAFSRRSRRLAIEQCESRTLFASLPFGALPHDTAEFLLGRIAVTPVLLESNGQADQNVENWDQAQIADVLTKID